MTAPGLLPCPFCGSSDVAIADATHTLVKWHIVHRCQSIGAITIVGHTSDEVAAAWNARTTDTALTAAQAEIARLTAALEYYADRNEEGYDVGITDYGGWTGYDIYTGPIIEDAGAIARAALDGQHKDTTK